MPKVITTGRTDLDEFFSLSGIREYKRLSHTPILAFVVEYDEVRVEEVQNAKILLEQFADDVQCMKQWEGKYRSDFFQFTVGDLRKYCAKNPKESYHIV